MIRGGEIGDHAEIAKMLALQGLLALHTPQMTTLSGNFSELSIRIRCNMLRRSVGRRNRGKKIQRRGRGGCAEGAGDSAFFARSAKRIATMRR
jgi:hypothetical protein